MWLRFIDHSHQIYISFTDTVKFEMTPKDIQRFAVQNYPAVKVRF